MEVRDAMSTDVLTLTPGRTLQEAARHMRENHVDAALILDPEQPGPGVVTQRDVGRALADGCDPSSERVAEHLTPQAKFATADWSLEQAAEAMIEGGFRHLAVMEGADPAGMLSMRDIVREWVHEGVLLSQPIPIHEAMTTDLLAAESDTPLREAARRMAERNVGAVVVTAEETGSRPELVTERVLMECVAEGIDVDSARVADHLSSRLTYSAPDWSLKQAAEAMIEGDFEHVIVVERDRTAGIISMRDIVRRWREAERTGREG